MLLAQQPESPPVDACGENPSLICDEVWDLTNSAGWAEATDKLLATPMAILMIVAIAWIANHLVRRAIKRLAERVADPESHETVMSKFRRHAPSALVDTGPMSLRSAARAQTLAFVLRSIASFLIWTIAIIMVLGELGVNLGPLIAGAGIAGAALGFGAQSLVKDFLAGIFMLIEDQYGVGDIVDVGEADGVVEAVSLRTTKLRAVDGTVWHVPNGTIERVGNMSQQWARALLDIDVAYGTDVDVAQEVIKRVADEVYADRKWKRSILETPEVWGVERLGADGISIRLVIKTRPGDQFPVMRELRRRISETFENEGIEIPFPQRTIWVRRDAGSSRDIDSGDDLGDLPGLDEPTDPTDPPPAR